ncbi:hypothetical protein GCM10027403_12550 [Arthrobacter tecti]
MTPSGTGIRAFPGTGDNDKGAGIGVGVGIGVTGGGMLDGFSGGVGAAGEEADSGRVVHPVSHTDAEAMVAARAVRRVTMEPGNGRDNGDGLDG